ncbi:hypothetical protein [Polaromonas sp. YR568]|uniref:hypothetical protein n=1 Tax=Polaromonas sp. YR568 TaxID=1855301 RepID=UPI00398BC043
MNHPSDTPPDGDFASYVERLTGANAAAGAREDLLKPQAGPSSNPRFSASSGTPSVKAALAPLAGVSFLTHVKWVVALWIATQALSEVLPGAGFLFLPALVAYGAWVVFKANRNSSGALVQRLRELARQAAEEAQKNQQPKKK